MVLNWYFIFQSESQFTDQNTVSEFINMYADSNCKRSDLALNMSLKSRNISINNTTL